MSSSRIINRSFNPSFRPPKKTHTPLGRATEERMIAEAIAAGRVTKLKPGVAHGIDLDQIETLAFTADNNIDGPDVEVAPASWVGELK